MGPVVTEIEDVDELLSGLETSKLDDAAILNWLVIAPLRIWHSNTGAVGKFEFVEMRPVPSRKRIVKCGTKVGERMRRGGSKESTRPRPAALPTTLDQVNIYGDPLSSRRVRPALRSASTPNADLTRSRRGFSHRWRRRRP